MSFVELGLSEIYAARLKSEGLVEPTKIQADSFKSIKSGKSVLGLSRTGTGKTLAFVAPLLDRLSDPEKNEVWGQVLVLVPTRELALQVKDRLVALTQNPQSGMIIVGGEAEKRQIEQATKANWWIATPGRLLDLLKRKQLGKIEKLDALILDEADRLLDMGFQEDIRAISRLLPKPEQHLFFSATLNLGVEEMAFEMGVDFEKIGEPSREVTVDELDHEVAFVGEKEKFHCLVNFIHSRTGERGIIFSNYKEKAQRVSSRLENLGAKCAWLTSDLQQRHRVALMSDFKAGKKVDYLVASDLAARGVDVEGLDWVINLDLPEDPAIYVHRVGRTARAGKSGRALSLVGFEDAFRLERLEKFLGKPVKRAEIPASWLAGELKKWPNSTEQKRGSDMNDASKKAPQNKGEAGPRGPHNRSYSKANDRPPAKPHDRPEERNQGRPYEKSRGPVPVNLQPAKTEKTKKSLLSRVFQKFLTFFIETKDQHMDLEPSSKGQPPFSGSRKGGGAKSRHRPWHASKGGGSESRPQNNRGGRHNKKSRYKNKRPANRRPGSGSSSGSGAGSGSGPGPSSSI